MHRVIKRTLLRLVRVSSLVLLAVLGTTLLMRFAPGYFTDTREIEAGYAAGANLELQQMRTQQTSVRDLFSAQMHSWAHGDLGRSRQYDMPVTALLRARMGSSARLLLGGLSTGWLLACSLALLLSARRGSRGEVFITGSTALLLALPVGALAIFCLLVNCGGPVLVLALLIAVRDFKLLYRLLRRSWQAPSLFYGRAQGLSFVRMVVVHIVPTLGRELVALGMMSLVIALSALVPVEVVFDLPGLGQLAWAAAMNRDLPVLVAITALLASCVSVAGWFAAPDRSAEVAKCA